MLTPKQLKRRQRGIGGSEIGTIVGVKAPGGRTAVDTWACKRRGPKGEIPPLVAEPPPDPDTCDAFAPFIKGDVRTAGSVLEAGIVDLYQMITGARVTGAYTRVHPSKKWAIATPDRYVLGEDGSGVERGLEIKLVNAHMADDWAHDDIPEYVRLQVMWGMACTSLERWDVCALIGGSEPRIHRLERDDELIDDLLEVGEMWWEQYVVGDVVPPAIGADDAMRALRLQWAIDDGEVVPVDGELADQIAELLTIREAARLAEKQAEERKKLAEAALCSLIGEHRGIEGEAFGKVYWGTRRGSPAWKEIARAVAPGGVVPESLVEQHRAESTRSFRAYPRKHVLTAAKEQVPSLLAKGEDDG